MKSKKSENLYSFMKKNKILFFLIMISFANVMGSSRDRRVAPAGHLSTTNEGLRKMKVAFILNSTPYAMVVSDVFTGRKFETSKNSKLQLNLSVNDGSDDAKLDNLASRMDAFQLSIAFKKNGSCWNCFNKSVQPPCNSNINIGIGVNQRQLKDPLSSGVDMKLRVGYARQGRKVYDKIWKLGKCRNCNILPNDVQGCVDCDTALIEYQSSNEVLLAIECSVKRDRQQGAVVLGYNITPKIG